MTCYAMHSHATCVSCVRSRTEARSCVSDPRRTWEIGRDGSRLEVGVGSWSPTAVRMASGERRRFPGRPGPNGMRRSLSQVEQRPLRSKSVLPGPRLRATPLSPDHISLRVLQAFLSAASSVLSAHASSTVIEASPHLVLCGSACFHRRGHHSSSAPDPPSCCSSPAGQSSNLRALATLLSS